MPYVQELCGVLERSATGKELESVSYVLVDSV
jgi:hypothetical protein